MKINKRILEKYISERVKEKLKGVIPIKSENVKKEKPQRVQKTGTFLEYVSKEELKKMIEEAITAKLKGSAFDTVKSLENGLKTQISKLTKNVSSDWIKEVEHLREKNGVFAVNIIGSGNTKIVIRWKVGGEKNNLFTLSTPEPFVAGDVFKENAYKFMVALLSKKEKIFELLQDVSKNFASVSKEIAKLNMGEPEDDEFSQIKNGQKVDTTTQEKPEQTEEEPEQTEEEPEQTEEEPEIEAPAPEPLPPEIVTPKTTTSTANTNLEAPSAPETPTPTSNIPPSAQSPESNIKSKKVTPLKKPKGGVEVRPK